MKPLDPAEAAAAAARRARSVLLGTAEPAAEFARAFTLLAAELKATLHVFADARGLLEALDAAGDSVRLVVVDAGIPDSLAVARRAVERQPLSELVLVCPEADEPALRLRLGRTPRLGAHSSIVAAESAQLLRVLGTAFQRADQRKAIRTTLDRFNARIAAPTPSVDAGQMRQLVISDRFLSSILESAFDAVVIADIKGRVTTLNPAAESLFGLTLQQAISRPVVALAQGRWRQDLAALLVLQEGGSTLQTEIGVGEDLRHVEISAAPVFDRAHTWMATSLILRDVTSRVQSEEALRTTEKLAAVGRLASTIAHEINNPLESVTNLLYLARQRATEPELSRWLEMAEQELHRIAIITSQTLSFHKQSTVPTEVRLAQLVREVLLIFQARLRNSRIEVVERLREDRPILALNGEIRQVLTNLIGNAVDALAKGGRLDIRTHASFCWRTMRPGVRVVVADTGAGMSAATLHRIFEAFYTTKGANGTGVGLWLSRDIVLRHEGFLHVRSSQQAAFRGTVFVIFLPYSPSAVSQKAPPTLRTP
ncbi:nitrogen regulation protein NR(II) [Acidipila sp. EB88]|uniref:two-component system sensor histidine kinase NtrB n=1 Tax=Acidipila sp. EB88 TaxID=2305226 RepID=UPI000F5F27F7|nr:ATP-binding protein [Acidipila sp. EB88]RRA48189.1 PAS domain S-box protein [Acidipila sp. EB88]